MTQFTQVISIFVTIFILGFTLVKITNAEYLLRPIPYEINQPITHNPQPITNLSSPSARLLIIDDFPNFRPSITFGDLLSSSDSSTFYYSNNPQLITYNSQPSSESSRSALIRELLSRLDNSYQESKLNFTTQQSNNLTIEQFNNQQITNNYQPFDSSQGKPLTTNYQPSTNSPTPFIPIPTLIAGINEIVRSNPSLTTNYPLRLSEAGQLSTIKILTPTPSPTLFNQLPTFNYQLPTTNYQPPTNNIVITPTPKNIYSIALLGDSMIDTLGRDLPDLQKLLKSDYPTKSFILLNYGQGATDMENGLFRLTHATTYLDKNYAPLLSFKPDILVIESFAYNHWTGVDYDLDRQWITLVKIIETVKEISPDTKIVLASTIAPNSLIYGDGKLNWNFDLKWQSANLTKIYLENMAKFASASRLPFADAYHPSLDESGNGLKIYINSGDRLHPSPEGALFFSQKVVEAIKNNQLIK